MKYNHCRYYLQLQNYLIYSPMKSVTKSKIQTGNDENMLTCNCKFPIAENYKRLQSKIILQTRFEPSWVLKPIVLVTNQLFLSQLNQNCPTVMSNHIHNDLNPQVNIQSHIELNEPSAPLEINYDGEVNSIRFQLKFLFLCLNYSNKNQQNLE